MTRWARKAAAEGGKALPATPWEEMAAAPRGAVVPARKRRRRKEYADRDVNGFAAHLRKANFPVEPGHGVADCPAVLESQDMGTGICYRCGSTEHDISKCKAKIDPAAGAFPYAKCFICGEMGHLSRSCPDNPKGLYAEDQVTVGRWATGMSADYEEVTETPKLQKPKAKLPKVVNF
uniref:Zinc finger CCHC-type containing 9 n=1 Tax=Anser cygnoides TaxID=8845 RepID=A0A8B9E5Q1_ANSCY